MIQINLKDFYPELYTKDYLVDVPQEVFDFLIENKKYDHNCNEMVRYHKAYFPLHKTPEAAILNPGNSIIELIELQSELKKLECAMNKLTEKQKRRLYMHYYLNMSHKQISQIEGVVRHAVTNSILQALKILKKEMSKK